MASGSTESMELDVSIEAVISRYFTFSRHPFSFAKAFLCWAIKLIKCIFLVRTCIFVYFKREKSLTAKAFSISSYQMFSQSWNKNTSSALFHSDSLTNWWFAHKLVYFFVFVCSLFSRDFEMVFYVSFFFFISNFYWHEDYRALIFNCLCSCIHIEFDSIQQVKLF